MAGNRVYDVPWASFESALVATLDDTKAYSRGIPSQQMVTAHEALPGI